jgi:GTP-binding protein EngB required for normal cell division
MTTISLLRNTLEIRIAILGNSECGKTTVLNALLKENYSSAVMSKRSAAKGSVACYNVFVSGVDENSSGSPIADLTMIEETTVSYGGEDVKTVSYEVETQHEMVSMRKDTQLTFVVVPGTIEGSTKYHSYIVDNWDTFDATIVVLDGKAGISDDDVKLLKLVKEQFKNREIPTMILCNKIDDPDNEKLLKHVAKAESKVKKIFNLDTESEPSNIVFLPCSALHAYIYRAGARLNVYQFEDFDSDMMQIIGKVHFGSKNWKVMTHEERFRKTHQILVDPKLFKEGMDKCGFTSVMEELNRHLGGAETQERMINKQIDLTLATLSPTQNEWISKTCLAVHKKQILLASGTIESSDPSQTRLRETFWKVFEEYQAIMFQKFIDTFPNNVQLVANPIQELMYYHKLLVRANWRDEEHKVFERAKELIRQYLNFLINHENESNDPSSWNISCKMSSLDWNIIMQSICLLAFDRTICETFGLELIICKNIAQETYNWKLNGFPGAEQHQDLKQWIAVKFTSEGAIVPACEENYNKVIHLKMKATLSDPEHYGHPLYKLVQLLNLKEFE